ncbi:hypothetical protein EDB80DRAFT_894669 [Ilyonectria destructans]|nr:hypothetical protein EDB80DRAFT_894669 [Ilyonectria destructans]
MNTVQKNQHQNSTDRESMQEEIYSMLDTLREVKGHLNNIQLRTFELEDDISSLISCNLRLLRNLKQEPASPSENEPSAPITSNAPPVPWKTPEPSKDCNTMGSSYRKVEEDEKAQGDRH